MRRTIVLGLMAVIACGGATAETPQTQAAPPRLPPGMAMPGSAGSEHTKPAAEAMPAPGGPTPEVSKGVAALQAGDLKTARSLFESASAKSASDADAAYYLGLSCDKLGDKPAAEAAYKKALAVRPAFAEPAANLGALYIEAERWNDAVAVLTPLAAKSPDRVELHENLALALAGKGDQEGATRELDAAVKLAPSDAQLLLTYAHQLAAWGKREPAIAKLQSARNSAGSNVELLAAIGHEHLLLRDTTGCIAAFDAAIAQKDAAPLRTERGLCKLAQKDAAGAQADFAAAVAKEPSYALSHYWLGLSLLNAKKTADGVKELEAYLKLDPRGAKAKSAQEAIAKARK